jgi:hypothetical protein
MSDVAHISLKFHKALGGINPSTATAATNFGQDTVHTIHAWILSTSIVFLILPDMNYEPLLTDNPHFSHRSAKPLGLSACNRYNLEA